VSVTQTFKCSCLSFKLQQPVVFMTKARVSIENFLPSSRKFIDCVYTGNVALCYVAKTLYL
jgi:hypothetical protein